MIIHKKIRVGAKEIDALCMRLVRKNLIVLRGARGYIMCGYLDLRAAEKIRDVAAKITGVSTIKGALQTTVTACTASARRLGIHKGQAVRDVLAVIA